MQTNGADEHKKRTNKKFSAAEDRILRMLVRECGEYAWEEISGLMPGRNLRQCKNRWFYYLSPKISKDPWTEEDDKRLIELTMQLNGKWVQISKRFRGRTDTQIKNRWNFLKKKFNLNDVSRRTATKEPEISSEIPINIDSGKKQNPEEKSVFDLFQNIFEDTFDTNEFSFIF